MANRWLYPSEDLAPGRVALEWWFDATNGAGTQVTSNAQMGHGIASINKSGAGTYVVTLQDNWVSCFGANATWAVPATNFDYCTCSQPDVGQPASTKQFTIQTVQASGAAVRDGAGNTQRVFVQLCLSNSNARGGT